MKFKTKVFFITLAIVFFLLAFAFVYTQYRSFFTPAFAITKTVYVYVDKHTSYPQLLEQLKNTAHIKHPDRFSFAAKQYHYPQHMKPGRYAIRPNTTLQEALQTLRHGSQTPVRFTFNNLRLLNEFTAKLDREFMLSGDSLLHLLTQEEYCRSLGFDTTTVLCMFVPNTYELFWTISEEGFVQRMKAEYARFWNKERLEKADKIGLNAVEVSILASIVEEETAKADEYPVVAGLYLNRLKKGMLLQADPTVKFAWGDPTIRRILNKHLSIDSPYNTYRYGGLPPGPLRMSSIQAIDAVLNYQVHNYLYMCAKDDFSGRHLFAVTLAQHNINANKYRAALSKRNILQ